MLWGKTGSGGEGMNGKGINPVCKVIDPAGMEQIPEQAGWGHSGSRMHGMGLL